MRNTNHQHRITAIATALLLIHALHDLRATSEDFCDPTLCSPENLPHVACNPVTGIQDTCPANATQVWLTNRHKSLIVGLHNSYRNKLANGEMPDYEPASNMLQMKWDDSLAAVAGFNARSCQLQHDSCRATHAHALAGQNLASPHSTSGYLLDATAIEDGIFDWFAENMHCNMDVIAASAASGDNVPDYGHFTQLVQHQNSDVGCALVQFEQGNRFTSYLVCNYGHGNIETESVYNVGEPCSQCPVGTKCSDEFQGLCL